MLLGGIDFLQLMRTHFPSKSQHSLWVYVLCGAQTSWKFPIFGSIRWTSAVWCGSRCAISSLSVVSAIIVVQVAVVSIQFSTWFIGAQKVHTDHLSFSFWLSPWGALDGPTNVNQRNNILHVGIWVISGVCLLILRVIIEWCLCFFLKLKSIDIKL